MKLMWKSKTFLKLESSLHNSKSFNSPVILIILNLYVLQKMTTKYMRQTQKKETLGKSG